MFRGGVERLFGSSDVGVGVAVAQRRWRDWRGGRRMAILARIDECAPRAGGCRARSCGADSWVDVELFGDSKLDWFRTFLELPGGIPSHDTFGRVFARLDPARFEGCFLAWVQAIVTPVEGDVVAIDGKVLRRS